MTEFALNAAVSSSSGFAPFELNYGYMPRMSVGLVPEPHTVPGVKTFVMHARQNLALAHDAIIESRVRQMHNTNKNRRDDDQFAVGDLVYMSTSDLSLPKGRATKLLLRYVGPFRVEGAYNDSSTYELKLPAQLRARQLHNRFHRNKLHPHHANDDVVFPH